MQFKELLDVVLGHLENLDLVDGDILKGENGRAGFFDFLADGVGNQFTNEVFHVTSRNFTVDDLKHAFTDGTDLGTLGVTSLLDLLWATLGEGDAEETEEISIRGLDIDKAFNQRLPFLDHGTELVLGQGHAVEIGQTDLSLDFVNTETELAESIFLALGVQITQ